MKISFSQFTHLLLLLLQAATAMAQPPHQKNSSNLTPEFDIQGHRGCRGLMPENTIPAMQHALTLGVTTLEMDVVITKDGVPILSHEPFFNHEITTLANGDTVAATNEKQYNIYHMNFDATQAFDVGKKFHPRFPKQQKMAVAKPALAAVFDAVKAYQLVNKLPFPFFNIETKCMPLTDGVFHPEPAVFVESIIKVVKEKGMLPYITLQSFDIRTLQYAHRHYPQVPTVLLIEDYDKRTLNEQLKTLGFLPAVYSPHYSLVNLQLVTDLRAKGIKLIPWTVNDKLAIQQLKSMGVDGIITDYPNLCNK
jgi:glycerophosphoryl diester phosphodiesterase